MPDYTTNKCNVASRTIFCNDNLEVLGGINSDSIDLIYLDPPFNKNKKFTAPLGSSAEGAEFSDIFRAEDVKAEWLQTIKEDHPELHRYLNGIKGVGKHYNFAYLAYMAIRLIECQRLLKQTGSLYLHCDPTMSHYLKTTMDCIFGEENFRNEIVWCYKGPGKVTKYFKRKHDIVLFYAKSKNSVFNQDDVRVPYHIATLNRRRYAEGDKGIIKAPSGCSLGQVASQFGAGQIPEDWWTEFPSGGQMSKSERTGYPTQKPLALLERIIRASSNAGDLVLDPFCGCATTCIAAERLGRQWIGIDVSHKAFEIVKERLNKEVARPDELFGEEVYFTTKRPVRLGEAVVELKHVYVISHPNYPGEFNVGIAKDVKARPNSYQTSDPDLRFQLEYSRQTPHFRELETYLHQKFKNKHEWVLGQLDDIKYEIDNFEIAWENLIWLIPQSYFIWL